MNINCEEFKIEIYVPEEFVIELRNKLNEAGACKIGDYDNCATVIDVRGYWRPLKGSNPYDGIVGKISEGTECKLEVRCRYEYVKDIISIIRKVHPYEEPVFNIIPLVNNLFE